MTRCEELTERMPAVARAEAHWDTTDLAHLATCPDCASGWRAVSSVAALRWATPYLDPDQMAHGVVQRLRDERPRVRLSARWLGGAALLATAAMLALLLWPRAERGGAELSPVPVFLPELDSLTTPQLESVLGTLDAPLGSVRTLDAPDLSGLSDDQLSAVLRSMEG